MLYRRFAFSLLALFALILLGAWGYVGVEGWSFADGLYMTVITVGTIGYGETNPLTEAGRTYTMLLIFLSTGVMVYATSSLTAIIVEGELHELFKRRKMNKRIESLQDHHIICGDSTIGQHILEELLRTDHPCIVIEKDQAKVDALLARDIPALHGNATLDATLQAAGVSRAAGLVTCLHTDADNLFVVLTARRLNPQLRIIAKAVEPDTREKLKQVGADGVVMPEAIGGLRMASELIRPNVVSFLDIMLRQKDKSIRVEEIRVPSHSSAIGKSLADSGLTDIEGATLVALSRGTDSYRFNPPQTTALAADDVLIMLGNSQVIHQLNQSIQA